MKTKRMFAALSALMITAAMAIPASAISQDEAAGLLKGEGIYASLAEAIKNPNWNGDRYDREWIVSYNGGYDFEGFAVTCADANVLLALEYNGTPAKWSEGRWSMSQDLDGADSDEVIVQPLSGLIASYGKLPDTMKGWVSEFDFNLSLPDALTEFTEPVYVVYALPHNALSLLECLQNEAGVNVLGAIQSAATRPMYFYGLNLSIELEEGATLTAEDFGENSKYVSQRPDGTWYSDDFIPAAEEITDYAEAKRICDEIRAMDGVANVWINGCYEDSDDDVAFGGMVFDSFIEAGDISVDGKTDVRDAVLMARVAVGDKDATTTQLGLDAADMNKDGAVNDLDLTMLLRKLAKLD